MAIAGRAQTAPALPGGRARPPESPNARETIRLVCTRARTSRSHSRPRGRAGVRASSARVRPCKPYGFTGVMGGRARMPERPNARKIIRPARTHARCARLHARPSASAVVRAGSAHLRSCKPYGFTGVASGRARTAERPNAREAMRPARTYAETSCSRERAGRWACGRAVRECVRASLMVSLASRADAPARPNARTSAKP